MKKFWQRKTSCALQGRTFSYLFLDIFSVFNDALLKFFSGLLPRFNLQGYMEPLRVLCFNDNLFTGVVPETITLLTNLEKLTV